MKKSRMMSSIGVTLAVLFITVFSMFPPQLNADAKLQVAKLSSTYILQEAKKKTKVVPIKGISYNVNASLTDNLKSFTGKKVNITLNSGKTFGGIVKKVGDQLVHLEKINGKDYFDALIRIEDISALDARFREFHR